MSTITREFTKEQLQQIIETDHVQCGEASALARIALASLEAKPIGAFHIADQQVDGTSDYIKDGEWPIDDGVIEVYAAPPAPVSVPDEVCWEDVPEEITEDDMALASAWAHGFNQCRAAMLKHSEPFIVTSDHRMMEMPQVEAINAVTAMLQGVEPVTTAYKLRDAVEIIRNSGIEIDAEKIFAERDALNAPDCWCRTCRPVTFSDSRFVVCPECGNKRCPHANDHRNACTGSNEPGQEGSAYPAAPQQEVESQIRKGKTVAMEEWELGARLTKHRFKP
ncbi:hypothetical protein [Enterobacter kobei]|uniref:hypothetical protein n=1 Tax=Enterobacter kobei TaxID=208224 RepID=UPI00084E2A24|nr:hypothetical protein [Enterobacter kobei]OEH14696.1 hypothetical protein AN693_0215375 [Enterobacter kobei]